MPTTRQNPPRKPQGRQPVRSNNAKPATTARGSAKARTASIKMPPKQRKGHKGLLIAILVLVVALITTGYFVLSGREMDEDDIERIVDSGTYYTGINVNGVDVSGMTYTEAKAAIQPTEDAMVEAVDVKVEYEGTEWHIKGAELNLEFDTERVLKDALMLGREGSLAENWEKQKQIEAEGVLLNTAFTVDETALQARVDAIAQEVYVEPQDATVDLESDAASIVFVEGKTGRELEAETLKAEVKQRIDSADYATVVTATTSTVAPSLTKAQLEAVTQRIGTYTTEFKGKTLGAPGRVTNIKLGAEKIHKQVVKPGQEFDFNEVVGPRNGPPWGLAPGIVDGNSMRDEYGGGICQVSSTLYNAVLRSGLTVSERRRHSWPISYVPKGCDATVSTGGPDFKFVNNTEYPVYIMTRVRSDDITVSIYGKSPLEEGVHIEIRSEVIREIKPDAPKTTTNSELYEGETEQMIVERTGYEVKVYKRYMKGEELIEEKLDHTDNYPAVQGVVATGTKPKPTPTPTPTPEPDPDPTQVSTPPPETSTPEPTAPAEGSAE